MTGNKMTTCLWFDHGKAREAAEFYARDLPHSHVGPAHDAGVRLSRGEQGNELTVSFTLLGQSSSG